jgi:hypothetical protein
MVKKINEGIASQNVDIEYDISAIRKLAGIDNNSAAVAGTPVSEGVEDNDLSADEAGAIADDIEAQMHIIAEAMESVEWLVRNHLPREYRYMDSYTFPQIKIALGGYGYADRMVRSFESLVEDLRAHAEGQDSEEI